MGCYVKTYLISNIDIVPPEIRTWFALSCDLLPVNFTYTTLDYMANGKHQG